MSASSATWRFGTGESQTGECSFEPPITFNDGSLVASSLFQDESSVCRYEWQSPHGAPPPTLDELAQNDEVASVGFEPASLSLHAMGNVAPLDDEISRSLARLHRYQFLAKAGAWTAPGNVGRNAVTVAVIDDAAPPPRTHSDSWTQVYRPAPNGPGWHGLAVARIIEELACPDAGKDPNRCLVTVEALRVFDSTVVTNTPQPGATPGRCDFAGPGHHAGR